MRMEDLDRAREVPGAADNILRTLDAFGFEWDEQVLYQSARSEAYAEAIAMLNGFGMLFPCSCTRREIASSTRPGAHGPVYLGTCRNGLPPGRRARSLRLRTESAAILMRDRIQGELRQDLEREIGDFVLRRADDIHAYQLAVVVDDDFQGISHVVRGADLVSSTPRQIFLLQTLDYAIPAYAHLPLVVDAAGRKVSKSDSAAPVDPAAPLSALLQAWLFLGQAPFPEHPVNIQEFWVQADATWDMDRVPKVGMKTLGGRPRH